MKRDIATRLVHQRKGGRLSATVNPPMERASTLLMPTVETLYTSTPSYGRMGLAVHRELEAGLCDLENASAARLAPSGLAACALAVASFVHAGDHILVADNVYGPTRRFCTRRLRAMGVTATFFPARIGKDLGDLVTDKTTAILLESPGSLTFELCDTDAIVSLAQTHGLVTIMDNTWGCGIFHKPLDLGVDVSVQALTKYVVGHADSFGGAVMTRNKSHIKRVADTADDWGISLGPDEAYMALRGLRTLKPRLLAHEKAGFHIAEWLHQQNGILRVLHPGLPDHPDHALWKRDFTGAPGLFGILFEDRGDEAFQSLFETLELFGFGFSWGGYESLLIPADPAARRSDNHWLKDTNGRLARIHIGLESVDDLIADLEKAFRAYH